MAKNRVLLLFSGGLDSILSAKLLLEQGLQVTGVHFGSYFFDANQAEFFARQIGINLLKKDLSEDHLKLIKKPSFGYGKAFNPCIDCHGLMFSRAWKIKQEENFDVLASGEVLGQRSFSQTRKSLDLIKNYLGVEVEILRPLSAKKMQITSYERDGLVSREKLLDLTGKGRKKQLALARKFDIKGFPTPSGGCLLTEKGFSIKLRNLLKHHSKTSIRDFQLLRLGRHFFEKDFWLILGRNESENDQLEKNFRGNDALLIQLADKKGPTALLITTKKDEETYNSGLIFAKEKIFQFSKKTTRGTIQLDFLVKKCN